MIRQFGHQTSDQRINEAGKSYNLGWKGQPKCKNKKQKSKKEKGKAGHCWTVNSGNFKEFWSFDELGLQSKNHKEKVRSIDHFVNGASSLD